MYRISNTFLAILLLAGCSKPDDQSSTVWMFYTGRDFLQMENSSPSGGVSKELYIAGVNDGLNTLASVRTQLSWIIACSMDKSTRELSGIFDEWLNRNPERLGEAAPLLYLDALRGACTT